MSGKNKSRSKLVSHFVEDFDDLKRAGAVQIRGRLVRQNDFRRRDERPCNGDPLFLTARKLVGKFIFLIEHSNLIKKGQYPFRSFLLGYVLNHEERIFHVFKDGQDRKQIEVLKNKSNILTPELRSFDPIQTVHNGPGYGNGARSRLIQASQKIQESAFPAP